MVLGEWIRGWIIENLDNRGSDNRGSVILPTYWKKYCQKFQASMKRQCFIFSAFIDKSLRLQLQTMQI